MVARRLTLNLDDAIAAGLSRLARDRGRSEDELVREAVERLVLSDEAPPRPLPPPQPGESVFDRLQRAGLIGCIKDAPPDLSTNPKYMEGFGE